jgi:hypothetical protein
MRNTILLLVALITVGLSNAQLKGLDFDNAEELKTDSEKELENNMRVLIKGPEGDYLIYYSSPTNIAIQRAVEKSIEICTINGLDFNTPSDNKTILDNSVETIRDFDNLRHPLILEESEVDQSYYSSNGSLNLFMNNGFIVIYINNN